MTELESGLHYRQLRRLVTQIHPRGTTLNAGNVTQALKGIASLQAQVGVKPLVLDYDQSLRRLNVVDRSFLIWLDHQDRRELLESIEIPVSSHERVVTAGANLFAPGESDMFG